FSACGKRIERTLLEQGLALQTVSLFPIHSSTKGELTRPEVPVPIAPAPTVQFVTTPAPDLAPSSSISAPAEPHLPYSTKHYRKRKLEAEQAREFMRQYNKKLPYRSCNKCFEDRNTGGH
ncbi:hypothetical protein DPMN_164765, partial [Dreissena polymorpha]